MRGLAPNKALEATLESFAASSGSGSSALQLYRWASELSL